jgi:3-oxoacyl-[acyl-carrier protein] reductase
VEPILNFDFKGKVAIVTGAGHGFGKEISKQLAIRGARVAGTDILEDELMETQRELESVIKETNSSGSFTGIYADLSNSDSVNQLVEEVTRRFNTVHILVNNAGGVVGQVHHPIEEITDDQWDKVVKINMTAAFYTIRAVAKYMKQQNYGRIVNISSGAGRSVSLTGIQAYASSKAGQIGLTRQMAKELGPYGITVNNVAPGFVLSNPSTIKQWEAMGEDGQQNLTQSISLKRIGKPEEIAYPVLFFASDFASYISGQIISADGGSQLF